MEKHIRELWDYLRDYGAENIHLDGGGKHQKLCFEYGGLKRSYLVGHKPSTDHHAIENTKAALRRMLGPPVPAEEKQPRKLEEMMVELNTTTAPFTYIGTPPISTPSKTWTAWLSAYHTMTKNKHSVIMYFVFPAEILQAYPEGMKVERMDDEHWKLSRGGRSHFREYGARIRLTFPDPQTVPFGSTEAEAVEADGAILVYLPMEGRAPVAASRTSKPWPTQAALTPLAAETLRPVSATALTPPLPVPATLEEEMREINRRILAVEAKCPYHLVRLEGGRVQWRAPIIE